MINRKIVMFIGMVLLVAGVAYASGVVFFGGNAHEDSGDSLILDIDLTEDNYNSGTKTFADDSGEGNDGVSNNAATFTTDKYGKSTGAMSFDGNSSSTSGGTDYISFTDSDNLDFDNEMTWSVWLKTEDMSDGSDYGHGILYKKQDPSYFSNTIGYNIWQKISDSYFMLNLGNGTNAENKIWSYGATLNDYDNEWFNLVISLESNGDVKFYFNGDLKSSQQFTINLSNGLNSSYGLKVGNGYASTWDGSISQVKVWNRTLSTAEITALYNSSKPKSSAGSRHKGLIGHWALDSDGYNSNTERITDKTPYENHGTNSGATLTTDQMGQSNRAMSFDGSINYVSIPTLSSFENISASVWVYPINIGLDSGLWAMMLSSGSSPNRFYFSAYNNKLQANIGSAVLYSNTAYNNRWYLMTATYNNVTKNASLYVDGVYTSSALTNLTISSNFRIGSYVGGGYPFNGSISDVRIYNRALSEDEIDTLYHSYRPKAASGSLQKGLVFDMPLKSKYTKDETVGSEIMTDRTPYSNDGQNYGATVGSSYTDFDGSSDYIDAGADSSFDGLTEVSISVWVNINNKTSFQDIVKKGISFSGALHPFALGIYNNLLYWDVGNSTLRDSHAYNFGNELDGGWHHIAVTYNGAGNKIIYIDGTLKYNAPSNLPSMKDDNQIRYISGSFSFNGSISSAKIYNRALSESEIKLLYDKGR